jgi:hypothetical protein
MFPWWQSGTAGHGGAVLVLQADGDVTIVDHGTVICTPAPRTDPSQRYSLTPDCSGTMASKSCAWTALRRVPAQEHLNDPISISARDIGGSFGRRPRVSPVYRDRRGKASAQLSAIFSALGIGRSVSPTMPVPPARLDRGMSKRRAKIGGSTVIDRPLSRMGPAISPFDIDIATQRPLATRRYVGIELARINANRITRHQVGLPVTTGWSWGCSSMSQIMISRAAPPPWAPYPGACTGGYGNYVDLFTGITAGAALCTWSSPVPAAGCSTSTTSPSPPTQHETVAAAAARRSSRPIPAVSVVDSGVLWPGRAETGRRLTARLARFSD